MQKQNHVVRVGLGVPQSCEAGRLNLGLNVEEEFIDTL